MSESGLPGQAGDYFVLAKALRAVKAGPLSDDPSDRALARAAGVSPTTIGDWLRGAAGPDPRAGPDPPAGMRPPV